MSSGCFDIEFRQVSLSEWRMIQSIAYATWPVAYGHLISKDQLNYMLELNYSERSIKNQMQIMKHEFIIALNKERPVGFTSVERNFMNTKQLWIHKLYILPSFQGKGYGKKFIDHITKLAILSENTSLYLNVFHKNSLGIAFYQNIGFSKIDEHKTILENGYEVLDYVMAKNIN